jgi:nucleotide-binding universal stress UspA family protein
MKAEKILVPTDFSECSLAALELATQLALESGARLLIVHAEEAPLVFRGEEVYLELDGAGLSPLEALKERLEQRLSEVLPTDARVECEHRVLLGEPSAAIVRLAGDEHVDLIVIATHGWRGLKRLLMGSVAEAVVRRAPCPVITVKPPVRSPALSLGGSS